RISKHVNYIQCTIFFFSSRRRHTRSKRDWSSDVCSSDLNYMAEKGKKYQESLDLIDRTKAYEIEEAIELVKQTAKASFDETVDRSEERRVGKESRSWSARKKTKEKIEKSIVQILEKIYIR